MKKDLSWIENLPKVKGEYIKDASLAKMTWFGVGGNADVLFEPFDVEDLANFIKNKDKSVPITVLGGGSNVIICDGGIKGVTIHLKNLKEVKIDGGLAKVGGGCSNVQFFTFCKNNEIAGYAFLGTVPGSIGGSIRVNAGCYGKYVSDMLVSAKVVDSSGDIKEVPTKEMNFEYRKNNAPNDYIFVEGSFKVEKGDREEIQKQFQEYTQHRIDRHPQGVKTAGSTFKNPTEAPAWKYIDEAGCRGLKVGGAQMSEKHSNFMINTGNATSRDLEDLGELVIKKVKEKTGVQLEWEVRKIGEY